MTDDLLLQTLSRIEEKVDKLANEVAETRGRRDAVKGIAALTATLTSLVITALGLLLRRHS
jgi:hypothetical protein